MIRINLLPEADKKKGGRAPAAGAAPRAAGGGGGGGDAKPGMIAAGAFVALAGVAGILFWGSYSQVAALDKKLRDVRAQTKSYEDAIKRQEGKGKEIQDILATLDVQIQVLESLDPPDRILWSQKLALLSKLIPRDVFLTDIEVAEQVTHVELESSKQALQDWEKEGKSKGEKRPETQSKPVVTYQVSLKGLATGEDNKAQFANVLAFEDALRNYKDASGASFVDQMEPSIDIQYIQATAYEKKYPVNEFVFRLRTKPPAEKAPEDEMKVEGNE